MVSISAVKGRNGVAPTTTWPSVTVIVPTRNRSRYLQATLNALSAQVYPADRVEVIVVDNESSDDTAEVVREFAQNAPFPVRYHRKQNDGPASSRNRGAEMASGEILAFTDSDCIPSPNWLRSGIDKFAANVGIVCGPVHPVWITADQPFFMHQIHLVTREDGLYPTANVFYRRDVFLGHGGFDERFRSYSWGQPVGGDDTDLAWRVRRGSAKSAFADGAVVYHQPSTITVRAYLLQSLAAKVIPQLVRSVPELRDMSLYRRYFIHRESALFYPFLAGVALSRRSRWAMLLTLPWVAATWPALKIDRWPPRRWPRMALRFMLKVQSSALLSATLIVSSIRNRRLVL